jgi:hypothetical protein
MRAHIYSNMALRLFRDPFFGDIAKFDNNFKEYQNMLGACDITETPDAFNYKLDAPGLQRSGTQNKKWREHRQQQNQKKKRIKFSSTYKTTFCCCCCC